MKHSKSITQVKRPQLACPTAWATAKGEMYVSLENMINAAKFVK